MLLSRIYGVSTLIGLIMWIPFPNMGHYLGAASITQIFVCAVSCNGKFAFISSMVLLLAVLVSLLIALYFAYNKKTYKLLIIMVWLDVIISVLLMFHKLFTSNYTNMLHMVLGLLLRCLFAFLLSHKTKESFNS